MTRIDKYLVESGRLKTRSQASMLIKQGHIVCNGSIVTKPSLIVSDDDIIEIMQDQIYVSRGAYKLIGAIKEFQLNLKGKVIADCGASTGGFTQVSLEAGASKVYAIDVGHNQLSPLLKDDDRVINLEGVNLKNDYTLPEKVDFVVADLSFISLSLVYPTMASLLKPNGRAVILIKPQFEAGRLRLTKNGIVKAEFLEEVLLEVKDWFSKNNYAIDKIIESPILGKTGNTEYLALIRN